MQYTEQQDRPNWLTTQIFLVILTLVVMPYIISNPIIINLPDTEEMDSYEWKPGFSHILGMTIWAILQLLGTSLILLMTIGYHVYTGRTKLVSLLIVLVPYVVFTVFVFGGIELIGGWLQY